MHDVVKLKMTYSMEIKQQNKQTSGSDIGLAPDKSQATNWTNDGLIVRHI